MEFMLDSNGCHPEELATRDFPTLAECYLQEILRLAQDDELTFTKRKDID
jgi:hypothetical protein